MARRICWLSEAACQPAGFGRRHRKDMHVKAVNAEFSQRACELISRAVAVVLVQEPGDDQVHVASRLGRLCRRCERKLVVHC